MKSIPNMCFIHSYSKMKTSMHLEHILAMCFMHSIWNMLNVIIEIIETFHTVSCSGFCVLNSCSFLRSWCTLHARHTSVPLRIRNVDVEFLCRNSCKVNTGDRSDWMLPTTACHWVDSCGEFFSRNGCLRRPRHVFSIHLLNMTSFVSLQYLPFHLFSFVDAFCLLSLTSFSPWQAANLWWCKYNICKCILSVPRVIHLL